MSTTSPARKAILLAIPAALFLAACTSPDDGEESAPTSTETTTEAEDNSSDESGSGTPTEDGDTDSDGDAAELDFSPEEQAGDFPDGDVGAVMTDLRHDGHSGYERLTFEFAEGGPSSFQVATTDEAIVGMTDTEDQLEGYYVVEVTFSGMDHEAVPSHEPDLGGGASWEPDSSLISEVILGNLFEGEGIYYIGLESDAAFDVTQDTDPDRLVIDFESE